MIREVGVELQARLRTRGVPLVVVDGPEPENTTTWGRERIVIERDREAAGVFGAPRSQSLNPKRYFNLTEPWKITIYAQSARVGSTVAEHERRVMNVARCVMNALKYVAAVRKNGFDGGTFQLITPPDLVGAQRPGGAVCELKFTWEHGAQDVDFVGEAKPTGTITTGAHTTIVRTTDADAGETACGA